MCCFPFAHSLSAPRHFSLLFASNSSPMPVVPAGSNFKYDAPQIGPGAFLD